jgi:proline dehydrogenase
VNPVRTVLLWASENATLTERLPRMRFVRASVRRFMPGEALGDALDAAARLAERDVRATLTNLGEHVTDAAQADRVAQHYLQVLDEIHARGIDVEISVKPTHLGLELDPRATAARIASLAQRAEETRTWVWLDMESSAHVQPTIDLYRDLRRSFPNTGICLQAYLHRTPSDVAELLAASASIRLVKGAYREPREHALQERAAIDRRYLELALHILRWHGEGTRLALGSHDVRLLERIDAAARGEGLATERVEIQMLYGIREADQVRLAAEGRPVRTLIAYGTHWYPWYMRRLAEQPSNLWFVLRNLVAR